MISHLKLRLVEVEEDVSCPAIYRLRAKLRDLMKGGQMPEQPVAKVVERSIETLGDLSKSCDDLRAENDRLLAELEELRRALASLEEKELPAPEIQYRAIPQKTAETTTVPEYIDVSELTQKLKDCEEAVADLRRQLDEKNGIIDSLNKDLETMVSQKDLLDEIAAMKAELQRREDKVSR